MKIIKANDGYVLTDGFVYTTEIYLPDTESGEEWQEITAEEAEKRQSADITDISETELKAMWES